MSCLALFPVLAVGGARAQDVAPVEPIDPDDSCWFIEGQVRDTINTDDDYRVLAQYLREAEPHVRRYVEDSLGRQQDAVTMAFRDFAAWYRHRIIEGNSRRLDRQQFATLVGTGFQLSVMLPGPGVVVSTIRSAASTIYSQVVDNTSGDTTDPQSYIDAISGELEDSDALRRTFAEAMFNTVDDQALRDRVEAIKFEYDGAAYC